MTYFHLSGGLLDRDNFYNHKSNDKIIPENQTSIALGRKYRKISQVCIWRNCVGGNWDSHCFPTQQLERAPKAT
jgi:hypothetical protein